MAILPPITNKVVKTRKPIIIQEASQLIPKPLHEKAKTERTIIVELDTPRHLDTTTFMEGAEGYMQLELMR